MQKASCDFQRRRRSSRKNRGMTHLTEEVLAHISSCFCLKSRRCQERMTDQSGDCKHAEREMVNKAGGNEERHLELTKQRWREKFRGTSISPLCFLLFPNISSPRSLTCIVVLIVAFVCAAQQAVNCINLLLGAATSYINTLLLIVFL